MECQAFEQLAGCAFPEEKVGRKFYAEIQRDLAARADQDEDDHEDEALEAPWAAVAADEEPCPTQPDLQLAVPTRVAQPGQSAATVSAVRRT